MMLRQGYRSFSGTSRFRGLRDYLGTPTNSPIVVSAGVLSYAYNLLSPSISVVSNVSTSQSVESFSMTLISPSVSTATVVNANVSAATLSHALVLQTPTVSTTANVNVSAGAQAFAIALQTPAITAVDNSPASPTEPSNLRLVSRTLNASDVTMEVAWDAATVADQYFLEFSRLTDGTIFWANYVAGTTQTVTLPFATEWVVRVRSENADGTEWSAWVTQNMFSHGSVKWDPSLVHSVTGTTWTGTGDYTDVIKDNDDTSYITLDSGGGEFMSEMHDGKYTHPADMDLYIVWRLETSGGNSGDLMVDVVINDVSQGTITIASSPTVTAGEWQLRNNGIPTAWFPTATGDKVELKVHSKTSGSPSARAVFSVSKLQLPVVGN